MVQMFVTAIPMTVLRKIAPITVFANPTRVNHGAIAIWDTMVNRVKRVSATLVIHYFKPWYWTLNGPSASIYSNKRLSVAKQYVIT